MDVSELLRSPADPIEQPALITAYVSVNRPAPTGFPVEGSQENLLWVIQPGDTVPFGPCRWAALHGSTLPTQGTEVLVAFDENNKPVVVWWEAASTNLALESGVVTLSAGKATVTAPRARATSPITANTVSGTPTTIGVKEREAGKFKLEGGSGTNEVAWVVFS